MITHSSVSLDLLAEGEYARSLGLKARQTEARVMKPPEHYYALPSVYYIPLFPFPFVPSILSFNDELKLPIGQNAGCRD